MTKRLSAPSSTSGVEKSGKAKVVTFRQEDSIALPNSGNRPSNTTSGPHTVDEAQYQQQSAADTRLQYGANTYGTRQSQH